MKSSEKIFQDIKLRLTIACRAQHINLEELKEVCEISEKDILDYSIMDIVHLAEYLHVSTDFLLGIKELDKATIVSIYKNQSSRLEALQEIRQELDKTIIRERNLLSKIKESSSHKK